MIEAALHEFVERGFSRVAECGMAEIVAEADGFSEDLIETQ